MSIPVVVPMLTVLAALGGTPVPDRAAIVEPIYRVERIGVEGDPAQVVLTVSREMRTAGWDLRVEAVETDLPAGRIVVRMEAVPPDGLAAQVISRREARVDLGAPPPGRYVLEIRVRADRGGAPEPVQAEILVVVGSRDSPGGR